MGTRKNSRKLYKWFFVPKKKIWTKNVFSMMISILSISNVTFLNRSIQQFAYVYLNCGSRCHFKESRCEAMSAIEIGENANYLNITMIKHVSELLFWLTAKKLRYESCNSLYWLKLQAILNVLRLELYWACWLFKIKTKFWDS